MRRRSALAAIAVATALGVAAGCGGDDEDTSAQESTTEAVTAAAAPTTAEQATTQEMTSADSSTELAALETAVTENFGGAGDPSLATSWFENIQGYELSGDTLEIQTDIVPDAEADRVGPAICGGVLALASDTVPEASEARVSGSDGSTIASCP